MGRWIAADLDDLRHINPLPCLSTAAYISALRSVDPDVSALSLCQVQGRLSYVHIPTEFRPLGKEAALAGKCTENTRFVSDHSEKSCS